MADLMNPGGGLTKSKLLLANANPSDVSQGKGFYSNGNKELQTGTLQERGQYQMAGGVGGGGSDSSAYVAFNNIPEGIYRKNGSDWAPEIRALRSDVVNYLGGPKAAAAGRCWANGHANGGGASGSDYAIAGHGSYDGWLTAAVTGYFAIWNGANNKFTFGKFNAGERIAYNNAASAGGPQGTSYATYIYI